VIPKIDTSLIANKPSPDSDPKATAKQVETVFMGELVKIMMEQTSFAKDKTISAYMPYITSEISKSLSERGIGIGDFVTKNIELNESPAPKGPMNKAEDKLQIPANGRITSKYGMRSDPIDGRLRRHDGIDIAMPEGTPVKPVAAGRVVFSGDSSGYGNLVIIDHGEGLTSMYAHNSKNLVKSGEVIDKNRIIALSGSTGRSAGPHLHFELRKDGIPVDPGGMIG
jgi:murein DD-endopeptidase MepM/ murein hydrolase activator NlpD